MACILLIDECVSETSKKIHIEPSWSFTLGALKRGEIRLQFFQPLSCQFLIEAF